MENTHSLLLKTRDTEISIDGSGKYSSIKVRGNEILSNGARNVVSVCAGENIYSPDKMTVADGTMTFDFTADGQAASVGLHFNESDISVSYEVVSVTDNVSAVVFGPLEVSIADVIGDVVGVAQGADIVFGTQSLNIKTIAGVPDEYADKFAQTVQYLTNSINVSVGNIAEASRAAARTDNGCVLHLMCKRRDVIEYLDVANAKKAMVLPLPAGDENAKITGAKVALFGCAKSDALSRIGEIEVEHGLPHPLFDGEWGKTARAAMKSYLISNFGADDWDFVIDKVKCAGWEYMYQEGPYEDWGHFTLSQNSFPGGDAQMKELVAKSRANGINVGTHTLSNFTTTNDAYVTPVPSANLLKQCPLTLIYNVDNAADEFVFAHSDLFQYPLSLNAVQIGDELIRYTKAEDKAGNIYLTGCTRGAFGTSAVSHSTDEKAYRMWDHPYNVFFPDIELQDKFADRIADLYNETGLAQISFDGLEGCTYTGHGQYAVNRFVDRIYKKWDHNVLNDSSRLDHWTWHMSTRMNWGEPWGEAMRTGQVESRIKNQDFFRRNLFPRMLGWFLLRLAERKFEASTLEDLEWSLSESAGFDAGYGMTIRVNTLKNHGQIDAFLDAIKNWDALRLSDSFSDELKEQLKDPKTEWHLEKITDSEFALYPMMISKPYICDLSEMQPGQGGGADWSIDNDFESKLYLRLRVTGDGAISNPSIFTQNGRVTFGCTVEDSQYLLYSNDGKAYVTDKNYNNISEATVTGDITLAEGTSAISFVCEHDRDDTPEVAVRFITYGYPETVVRK